jgi:Spy/CpxP family protein refolding chaperone
MSRVSRLYVVGLTVLALAVAATAHAQFRGGPGGPGGMMGRAGGMLMLLASEQVQKELKVTDDQKAKLKELADKQREEMRKQFGSMGDMQNLSREERQARFEKMQKEAEPRIAEALNKVGEILQPEQLKRLKQIQLQTEGSAALRRKEVAEALGLSADQQKKLEDLNAEASKKREALFQEMRPAEGQRPDREKMQAAFEKGRKLREESDKEAMAVLTADQKAKLREMMGEPFELDRSQMFQCRGNRGGRGGQQPKPSEQEKK